MKKLNTIAVVLILLLFTTCKKLEELNNNNKYTLSGYLYQDCNLMPVANKEIVIFQSVSGGVITPTNGGKILASTTTDANGYFKFEYKDDGGGAMKIQYKAGAGYNSIMEEIPKQTTDESLVLYLNPTTNIQVSLNVINPHSVNDTLVIGNFTFNPLQIPCPLVSGILYTVNNYNTTNMVYGGKTLSVGWYFKNANTGSIINDFKVTKHCSDTIFVTCDIN